MNVEIAVSEINQTVQTYTLYGEATLDSNFCVDFTWSQEAGLPAEVEVRLPTAFDDEDVDVNKTVLQAVSEMFDTGNLIEPGYVFETEV